MVQSKSGLSKTSWCAVLLVFNIHVFREIFFIFLESQKNKKYLAENLNIKNDTFSDFASLPLPTQ